MNPYLLVNGNFVTTNGMDMPNLALAKYLASRDEDVHLVTHYAQPELAQQENVTVHYVRKPLNSYFLATPALNAVGRRWAARITERKGRVLVNGGNCIWNDVNWVHYVHAAYRQPRVGSALRTLKNDAAHRSFLKREKIALGQARIVIANSERTRHDVIERLGVAAARVHTIYYGIDSEAFHPPTEKERTTSRVALGWHADRLVIAFVGALGDRRKGFDTLFAAWRKLCASNQWNADLAVIGTGAELHLWTERAADAGLVNRIHFLGFRKDVPNVLAACDALVAPTRYEAYGQGVHEALCCGLPAIVSQSAGVAERFSPAMRDLLLPNPEDTDDLVERLQNWHSRATDYRMASITLSHELRSQTWERMSAQIVALVEGG